MPIGGIRPATHDPEPRGARLTLDGTEKSGLPDTGLAGQEEEPAAASAHLGDPAICEIEQVIAPHEHRAHERPPSDHDAEV
jgi:hypothetical protein